MTDGAVDLGGISADVDHGQAKRQEIGRWLRRTREEHVREVISYERYTVRGARQNTVRIQNSCESIKSSSPLNTQTHSESCRVSASVVLGTHVYVSPRDGTIFP